MGMAVGLGTAVDVTTVGGRTGGAGRSGLDGELVAEMATVGEGGIRVDLAKGVGDGRGEGVTVSSCGKPITATSCLPLC